MLLPVFVSPFDLVFLVFVFCSCIIYLILSRCWVTYHLSKSFHLRGFDDEMRAVVARNLEGRGINLHPTTNLTEVLSDWIFWFLFPFEVIDISIYYKPNWDWYGDAAGENRKWYKSLHWSWWRIDRWCGTLCYW